MSPCIAVDLTTSFYESQSYCCISDLVMSFLRVPPLLRLDDFLALSKVCMFMQLMYFYFSVLFYDLMYCLGGLMLGRITPMREAHAMIRIMDSESRLSIPLVRLTKLVWHRDSDSRMEMVHALHRLECLYSFVAGSIVLVSNDMHIVLQAVMYMHNQTTFILMLI
jgi:hypothetical protein